MIVLTCVCEHGSGEKVGSLEGYIDMAVNGFIITRARPSEWLLLKNEHHRHNIGYCTAT